MMTGQSMHSCLRREVLADHEAQSRTKASCSGDSCGSVTIALSRVEMTLSFGGIATQRTKRNTPSTVASVLRLITGEG